MFLFRIIWNWRRLWCRLFYWLLVPLLVLYLCSNIALNSKYSKQRVASALEEKTGVPWSFGTLNWTPNGQLNVYDAKADLGDGSLDVAHLKAQPNLALLLKKRTAISSIEIFEPTLDVSAYWLIEQFKPGVLEADSQPTPPIVAKKEPVDSTQSGPQIVPSEKPTAATPPIVAKKIEVKPPEKVPPKAVEVEMERDAWIHITDASITLRGKKGEAVKLTGINANIPFGGQDLIGAVSCESVMLLDRVILEDGGFNVHKKGPVISVEKTDVNFFGAKLKPEIAVIRGNRGTLFLADLLIPQQSGKEILTHLGLTVGMSVEAVAGRMRLTGSLFHPRTWRGFAEVRAKGLDVMEGHRGGAAHFDRLAFRSQLDRGILNILQAELMGEDISVMSNGKLSMNGRGFGIVRAVTSPEKKQWLDRLFLGSRFFQGTSWGVMRQLDTGDRYYMDVSLDGVVTDPMMRLENMTGWQPVWPAVDRLKRFVKKERTEDIPLVNP